MTGKKPGPELFASPQKRNVVLCLLLVVITLGVYNQVNHHPFVNYDDDRYVTENPHVRAGLTWQTFTWALTATEQANWHPLTWMSHALDCQLFRLNPAGHHLTNLLLHALNVVLLFLLLVWGTGRTGPALFVAALFALHPINVESVAWVAERKNMLSTLFFLLALGAYGWYTLKPDWRRYLAVTTMFVLGLMSKPMVITLPCVLLLLDYWPLNRIVGWSAPGSVLRIKPAAFSRLVLEKIPLLALSAASAVLTMQAQQRGGAMRSTVQFPLGVRIENAIVAYAMYLWKMVWPARLAPLYPHPGDSLGTWQVGVSSLVLCVITAACWRFRAKGYPLAGWFWFLGMLVPVIGLIQVGDQAMADRYAYLPLIGVFAILAFGLADLRAQGRVATAVPLIFAACVLVALAAVTYRQIDYWSSNYDLWSHTLAVTDKNFIAQDNLGGALVLLDRAEEAYPHFQLAVEINPRDPMSHTNLGVYLQEHGRLQEAVEQYETTIRLTSDAGLLANTYANLGSAYRDLGQDGKAVESYDDAVRLNPGQFNAYLGRAVLLEREGKIDDAISQYSRSTALHPTVEGYLRLGHALQTVNRKQEAITAYQQALSLDPNSSQAQDVLRGLDGR